MSGFPLYCLRGLRSKNFLLDDASSLSAVVFDPDYRTAERRSDGGFEASINWEDDEGVLAQMLRDHQVAAHGVARLARLVLDQANGLPNLQPYAHSTEVLCVGYERAPLPNNVSHGNILFGGHIPKPVIRMISSYLAMHAQFISR